MVLRLNSMTADQQVNRQVTKPDLMKNGFQHGRHAIVISIGIGQP
jgi:hypothetical protein